jgi:hypothetical protein
MLIPTQDFDLDAVEARLGLLYPTAPIAGMRTSYIESGDDRYIYMYERRGKNIPVAFAHFISRVNGRVWQTEDIRVASDYADQQLEAAIIEYATTHFDKSLQSGVIFQPHMLHLWTVTIPAMHLSPVMYDSKTRYTLDLLSPYSAYAAALAGMHSRSSKDSADPRRYCWILPVRDSHTQEPLRDHAFFPPYRGLWHEFTELR